MTQYNSMIQPHRGTLTQGCLFVGALALTLWAGRKIYLYCKAEGKLSEITKICSSVLSLPKALLETISQWYESLLKKISNPHVTIYFDINKTMILKNEDNSTVDQMINAVLADAFTYDWGKNNQEMTYSNYVNKVLHPDGTTDKNNLKKIRRQTTYEFLSWLEQQNHPLYPQALEKFNQLKKVFSSESPDKDQAPGLTVFPSFYRFIKAIEKCQISYNIVLYTFGNDLEEVSNQLKSHKIDMYRFGKFKNEDLFLKDGKPVLEQDLLLKEGNTTEKVHSLIEMYKLFTQPRKNFAVQTDYDYWNTNVRQARYGKPFLFSPGEYGKVQMIFDDNINDSEIIRPLPLSGTTNSSKEELLDKHLFPVNPLEAATNEKYFQEKVVKALNANGYTLASSRLAAASA